MMHRVLSYTAFIAGLVTVGWVGAGYVGANPLALVITVLIIAGYGMGALELHRFDQATTGLQRALAQIPQSLPSLGAWLAQVPAGLQNAVRLRVEGERVGLPGPALTPYLAGLLVLLGMLGTFLGMVVTLKGTGLALESATDLPAIRASLSAPVKGLGVAFGTSIAGIAASAMLGLMSALCRHARAQVAQGLDGQIATTLRAHSLAHRREETFRLMQQQAQVMPALVDRLQTMISTMEQQGQALNDRLIDSQARFQTEAQAAYGALAQSVDRSLKDSLSESARIAGATLQPVAEATMAGIAREAAALHTGLATHVHQQLDGLAQRFDASTMQTAGLWQAAMSEQQRTTQALTQDLRASLDGFAHTFDQRATALVDGVASRLDGTATHLAQTWRDQLQHQQHAGAQLASHTQQTLAAATAGFEQQAAALLRSVQQAHADLQDTLASRDAQRLGAWTQSLNDMAAALQQQWQQAGAHTLSQQEQICATLAHTASTITTQAEAQSSRTIAEITRLVQAASEAPRAAAEVMAELRQKLSDSMARDNTMLEERTRLLGTLSTLLDAVNHASTEQRSAIDALVAQSAGLMQQVGQRFTERADAATERLDAVAGQITGSAVEVASLGEAFGFAVQLFSQANDKLMVQLQGIESALGQSMARSDEQLAYYVAQAREVIDLSIASQKQVVDELQRLARQPAAIA